MQPRFALMLAATAASAAALRWPTAPFSRLPRRKTFTLLKGDISKHIAVDALVTSANPRLEGTRQANFWKFAGRTCADAAIRDAGGARLAAKTATLARRAAPLETGSAHVTAAGGSLRCKWVVHAIAPR